MFKVLPFNQRYQFDTDGNYWVNGDYVFPKDPNAVVTLDVYGQEATFPVKWLGLIAHFETDMRLDDLRKIDFIQTDSKLLKMRCGHLMIFKGPIPWKDGFFRIPGFPMYVINREGCVFNINSGTTLTHGLGPYGYPIVHMRDPDKNNHRQVTVHLLLARTFIPNDSPTTHYVVNHKDGIKTNNNFENLEWVTPTINNNHAVWSGLRGDNYSCLVRDIVTGEITAMPSVSAAMRFFGYEKRYQEIEMVVNDEIVPRIFRDRYEVKLINDDREWYYKSIPPKKSANPALRKIIEIKNLENGNVTECIGLSEAARIIGSSKNSVKNAITRPKTISINGHLLRIKTNKDWSVEHRPTREVMPRPVKVTNHETGEVLRFPSMWGAAKHFNVEKSTMRYRVTMRKRFDVYTAEEDITVE